MCKMRSSTFLFLLRCFLLEKSNSVMFTGFSIIQLSLSLSLLTLTLTLSLSLLSDKNSFQKVFLAISALKNLSKFLEKYQSQSPFYYS